MMKKNIIIISSGLALAAVLAIIYFIFINFDGSDNEVDGNDSDNAVSEQNNSENDQDSEENFQIFKVNGEDDVWSVEFFKDGAQQYRIYREAATDALLLEDYERFLYSDSLSRVISSAASLSAIEKIEDPLEDSEYGIAGENSPYVIKVTSSDGTLSVLYVGDPLISGSGYYCKVSGKEGIYAVGETVSRFFVDEISLLSTLLANPLDSSKYHYTEELAIYKDMLPFIRVEFVPEEERFAGDVYGYYKMTYPGEYTPSDINYDAVLKALISPTVDTIVTTDLSNENLIKYGFMDENLNPSPSYEIEYTLDGETRFIYFGKRTDDGLIYVMSPAFGFIGLAGIETHFPFLDWDLVKFINPSLFGININYVARVSVSGHGFSDSYVLSGKDDELVVKNQKTGETVDTQNFRNFYRGLLLVNMEGYAESNPTDEWLLTFTVESTEGNIYEFKFYRLSTRKCYYTVNGSGEFYVSIDDVEKILSDAEKLAQGITINADAQT